MTLYRRAAIAGAVLSVTLASVSAGSGLDKQPSHSIVSGIEVSKSGGLGRLEIHGKTAAVLQRDEGIVALVDISDPSSPKVLGRYDDSARQSLDGDLAFSSDGKWLFYARQTVQFSKDGLHVLDVSDPSRPALASYQPGGGTLRVTYYDDGTAEWVIVMDATSGMVIYRFEPTTGALVPVHVDPLPALKVGGPASAGLVVVDDPVLDRPLLYATTGQTGLQVFDLSDPTRPELLGQWDELGLAEVEVDNVGKRRIVYAASEYWFTKTNPPVVVELDATKLGAIKQTRLLSVGCKTDDSQRIQGMALSQGNLYVANSTVGLPVFFGANSFRLVPVQRRGQNAQAGYQGSPYVFDVEVKGAQVFSTDAASGYLSIARHRPVAGWTYNSDELGWHTADRWKEIGC